jgi:hypothetical protein
VATDQRSQSTDERRTGRRVAAVLVVVALCGAGWILLTPRLGEPIRPRYRNRNNLQLISLALINYSATDNGWMPPAVVTDTSGRPLYSWRVLLLPYLEYDELYKEFHLDEPWDSPHNIQLLKRMPKEYARPGDPDAAEFRTCYRVFMGEAAPFPLPGPWQGETPPKGRRLPRDFPDGTSKTLFIVEAADAVPWTKPDELVYDPDKPLPKLGRSPEGDFQVSLMDGSVRTLPKNTSEKTLRAYITRNGHEQVEE